MDFVKTGIVFGIDFPYNALHCHTVSRVLARKENAKHRACNQGNQTDNNNNHDGNPTACGYGGYKSLDACNNRFNCGNRSFYCRFHRRNRSLGSGFCCLCSPLSRFCRSLCRCLRCFGGMLGCFDSRLRGSLCGLNAFLGGLDRTFCGCLDRLFSISGGSLNRLFALLSGLDKLRFCPLDAIGSRGTACSPVTDLQAVVMLFGGFCRLFLFICRYFILCLADISPCFLDRLLTLLVELVDTLVLDTVSSVGKPVGGIFRSGVFISIAALFRFILCFRIGGLHTLGSNGGFVYGLYRAFDRISGFYISH